MTKIKSFSELEGLFQTMTNFDPTGNDVTVYCHACGHFEVVKKSDCLRSGWPKHCEQTMLLDAPQQDRL